MGKLNVDGTEIQVLQIIAFEFASWVSPQFKLYLTKEFERLKKEEQALLGWSTKRELAKILSDTY